MVCVDKRIIPRILLNSQIIGTRRRRRLKKRWREVKEDLKKLKLESKKLEKTSIR